MLQKSRTERTLTGFAQGRGCGRKGQEVCLSRSSVVTYWWKCRSVFPATLCQCPASSRSPSPGRRSAAERNASQNCYEFRAHPFHPTCTHWTFQIKRLTRAIKSDMTRTMRKRLVRQWANTWGLTQTSLSFIPWPPPSKPLTLSFRGANKHMPCRTASHFKLNVLSCVELIESSVRRYLREESCVVTCMLSNVHMTIMNGMMTWKIRGEIRKIIFVIISDAQKYSGGLSPDATPNG